MNNAAAKFKINIIDFIPFVKKIEVGKYADGTPAFLGDVVKYHGEDNWFISYRYGDFVLKQVGMIAMIGLAGFKKHDFSQVEPTNIIGAGADWLVIGFETEPFYETVKPIIEQINAQ